MSLLRPASKAPAEAPARCVACARSMEHAVMSRQPIHGAGIVWLCINPYECRLAATAAGIYRRPL